MTGIVICGAGECGVRAAFALREKGYDGKITLIGDEPHLPYERPPLSKQHPVNRRAIATEDAFGKASIGFMRGCKVEAIDTAKKSVRLGDGSSLAYEKLLVATGARPRLFPGMEQALTLRTCDDAEVILGRIAPGVRLAIIGGGFIGLELAATARKMGADVTVIEAADRLMARAVPPEIAAVAEARHRSEGVDILFGTQVASAGADHVALADGRHIEADLVVAGVGAAPNTESAEAAGIAVDNGITVDECFRASVPDVYAAGDCCSFPYRGMAVRLESWRAAQDQGNHVAAAMLDATNPYRKVPWFWSDQYDLTLQVAGLPEQGRTTHRRDLADDAFILFQTDGDGVLLAAAGIGTGNAVAKDIRLGEMMIERGNAPDPARLTDPSTNLKALLRS
jgi:3-phenylpropionate/trans-cinnamate dioxygenase ferredoxin reductase subunit